MIRRHFLKRMAMAAVASGLLGAELLARRPPEAATITRPVLYGSNDPVPIEDVLRQMVDDWAPGTPLDFASDFDFRVLQYEQAPMTLYEALRAVCDVGGYDLRLVDGGLVVRDMVG